jgi:hypothetical protein
VINQNAIVIVVALNKADVQDDIFDIKDPLISFPQKGTLDAGGEVVGTGVVVVGTGVVVVGTGVVVVGTGVVVVGTGVVVVGSVTELPTPNFGPL